MDFGFVLLFQTSTLYQISPPRFRMQKRTEDQSENKSSPQALNSFLDVIIAVYIVAQTCKDVRRSVNEWCHLPSLQPHK